MSDWNAPGPEELERLHLDGGPAFPQWAPPLYKMTRDAWLASAPIGTGDMLPVTSTGKIELIGSGMSLRDWFAGQALAGMLANDSTQAPDGNARVAYLIVDAMLKARKGDGT